MDELVERVARELCIQDLRDPEAYHNGRYLWERYAITARAIIPIVQADQRERDAGIAEKWLEPIMATKHENDTYRAIATAIRGAE